jgi:hypothetical protein
MSQTSSTFALCNVLREVYGSRGIQPATGWQGALGQTPGQPLSGRPGPSGRALAEANVYLLSRLELALNPSMAKLSSIADGLVAYRQFFDEENLDWRSSSIEVVALEWYPTLLKFVNLRSRC